MAHVASAPSWGTRVGLEVLCEVWGGLGPRVLGYFRGTKVPGAGRAAPSSGTSLELC